MTHNLVHQHHVNYRTNHCLHKCAHVGGRKAQQEKLVLQATDSTAYAAHVQHLERRATICVVVNILRIQTRSDLQRLPYLHTSADDYSTQTRQYH